METRYVTLQAMHTSGGAWKARNGQNCFQVIIYTNASLLKPTFMIRGFRLPLHF